MAILTTTQAGLNFVGGTTFIQTGATTLMAIATNGNIQFSQYGAGTLVTDASGNITVSSGGGAGGPYLPLSAGSTVPLSGDLYLNDSKFVRFTTTGGSNGNASIDFSTGAAFSFVSNSSYAPMVFKTSSTERMRILANGNVGIGLTAPLQKLHVDGSTQLGRNGNNTAGDPQKTLISGQGIEDATTGNFYGSYGFLELNANNNYTGSARRIAITNGLLSNRFAIIRSDTNLGPMQLGVGGAVPTGAVADFVIDTSGNVGINATSPAAKLDVEAGSTGAAAGDATTAVIFRAGRQNVWFQNQRTVAGTDWNNNTFKIIAKIDSTSHQSINFVNDASYNEHIDIYTGNQSFNTRFNANGNVGIGTTTPFSGITNTGLNVDTGGHSSIMIGDGVNDGGMIQSSDNSRRIIIGANVYDSPTGSWSRFNASGAALIDVYGEAHKTRKYTREELKDIIEEYKQKTKALKE